MLIKSISFKISADDEETKKLKDRQEDLMKAFSLKEIIDIFKINIKEPMFILRDFVEKENKSDHDEFWLRKTNQVSGNLIPKDIGNPPANEVINKEA